MTGGRRVLVLQHEDSCPLGLLGEWGAGHGWSWHTVRLDRGEAVPDVRGFDRLVSLGATAAADDDTVPWQAREQHTLTTAAEAGVPILGVCFGGQALARALGGGVRRAARPEFGWVHVGARDGVVSDGPWLAWHEDEILAPEGAEILAANPSGVQAFRAGPHVGLQFHPEIDAQIIHAWVEQDRLDRPDRIPDGIDEETAREAPAARLRAFALFDALLGA